MSNRKKESSKKRYTDQAVYSEHPYVKKVATGKAVTNVKKADTDTSDSVFKVGMTAVDLVKVQSDLRTSVGKKVCAELGDELKPPYTKSKYADSRGTMPQDETDDTTGAAPTPYTGVSAARYKDQKSPLVEDWTRVYRKYKDELANMKVHIVDNYVSEDFKILLDDDDAYNAEVRGAGSMVDFMEILMKYIKKAS